MATTATKVIIPPEGIFRTVFLYVGQGEATLMAIPDGKRHIIALIDSNKDESLGGINLPQLFSDLNRKIDVFINTHPHSDHLKGIKEISEQVNIAEIWHSGHTPGKDHKESYDELQEVIDNVTEDGIITLEGTRSDLFLGDVSYNILAPAEYVSDEIDGEDDDARYRRIHEQCSVLRFCYGSPDAACILVTGDSDLSAWRNHITDYHKDRIPAVILSASHHGSRTFFKDEEEDDPYTDHIEIINASYVVISSPKQDESRHGHPHDDALEIYKEYFDEENILHLGANRECVIVDIAADGSIDVYFDKELVEEYGYKGGDGGGSNSSADKKFAMPYTYTAIDRKPMG